MSREETFEEFPRDRMTLRKRLWEMVRELGSELRSEEDPDYRYARAVRLRLRYPDFETLSRSRVLDQPTRIDEEIYAALEPLLDEAWIVSKPVRLLGAGLVLGDGSRQFGLFEEVGGDLRKEKLAELKDALRTRFGDQAMKSGRDF
jgi:DNA polymerase-4